MTKTALVIGAIFLAFTLYLGQSVHSFASKVSAAQSARLANY